MDKPIDFNIMRINRNAQKICRCDPPSYEIDTTNRLVQCVKCNAYIQPFDALMHISENMEQLNKGLNKLTEDMQIIEKEVNSLLVKRFRMNTFREIQNSYMRGMMPVCPHCEKAFDPTEINRYANKDYCGYKRKKEGE